MKRPPQKENEFYTHTFFRGYTHTNGQNEIQQGWKNEFGEK